MLTTQRKLFVPNAVYIPTRMGKKAGISTEPTARFSWSMANTPTARSTPKKRGRTTVNPATSSDGVISSCPTNQR